VKPKSPAPNASRSRFPNSSHCSNQLSKNETWTSDLDTVRTVRGSGWVRSLFVIDCLRRTHPLPRTVLTVSKCKAKPR
jgi:hypothetical protein